MQRIPIVIDAFVLIQRAYRTCDAGFRISRMAFLVQFQIRLQRKAYGTIGLAAFVSEYSLTIAGIIWRKKGKSF